MPVPATTGSLKSSIHEMEVGDYIVAVMNPFNDNTNILGFRDSLIPKDSTEIECPLTGYQHKLMGSSNILFPMVKVAKGLLVADRVAVHSISWDKLNANKNTQGSPWSGPNIIPTMTSNTSPSGVASASDYAGTYEPWKAFNKSLAYSSSWVTNTGLESAWLSYKFDTPKLVKQYALIAPATNAQYMVRDWTFEGSNDGLKWEILDKRISQASFLANEKRTYNIDNNISYHYYRIHATNPNTKFAIAELEMYETAGIIRSLTGGVAYADANGNRTNDATATNYGRINGAWPTNSEWDKYIVNFPSELIQPEKTLDDVFHYSNCATWTQDTPATDVSINTARTLRGTSDSVKFRSQNLSSSAIASQGFRPVFSYKE